MKNRGSIYLLTVCILFGVLSGCSNNNAKLNQVGAVNKKTNVKYKDIDGIEEKYRLKYQEEAPAPGLVYIPGGTFIMGGSEKDIQFSMDNRERQVTVQSYYIDETEVANVDWKLFLYDIEGSEGAEKLKELTPDTLVWRRDLAFNEPLVENYYKHPAFNMYPVVGISWHQANEYCKWRTKKVNEKKLEEDENAVAFPSYRLPTEAEWEYAARGLQESEVYSWEGKSLRGAKGAFNANFKRGRGDYAGWAGEPGHWTDNYSVTAPVAAFPPNDFNLYNMSGNVAEWTQDTYRVLALEDVEDLNPYRRKGKTEYRPDQWLDDYTYTPKNSLLFNPDPKAEAGGDQYDNVKVYRGGSWADLAYFLSPGVRRFYNADSSSSTIGFRCAMIKVGSPMSK